MGGVNRSRYGAQRFHGGDFTGVGQLGKKDYCELTVEINPDSQVAQVGQHRRAQARLGAHMLAGTHRRSKHFGPQAGDLANLLRDLGQALERQVAAGGPVRRAVCRVHLH